MERCAHPPPATPLLPAKLQRTGAIPTATSGCSAAWTEPPMAPQTISMIFGSTERMSIYGVGRAAPVPPTHSASTAQWEPPQPPIHRAHATVAWAGPTPRATSGSLAAMAMLLPEPLVSSMIFGSSTPPTAFGHGWEDPTPPMLPAAMARWAWPRQPTCPVPAAPQSHGSITRATSGSLAAKIPMRTPPKAF